MAGLLVALLITSDQTFAFGAGGPCGPRPFVPGRAAHEGGADVPERLAAEACDRIDACDGVIRAMLPEPDRRGRLRAAAAELERAWPRAGERPPLWGLLVGVKDVFHLAGFDTRAGAALPPGALLGDRPGSGDARLADAAGPLDEGTVIRRLRDAGALFVGKTVTAEFAFAEPGPTRNPLDPSRTPGGSSSGSAAAVAAGYCRAALGTQTIGSVIRPAAFCGLFALKPTYGRVPCNGLVPFSPSVDTVGWMTADATALADVAAVLCEGWATEAARPDRPLVLGVPDGPYLDQAPPDARASFEEAVGRIAAAGHDVRRVPALADVDDVNRRHRELVAAEMAEVHAAWLARWGDRYRPRTREIIERGRAVAPADVDAARYGRSDLRASLERAMDGAGLDLWLAPAASGAAPRGLDSTGDPILQLPWTHAGMPTATVPADRDADGMPIGVQLVARSGRDEDLVAWLPGLAEALAE